MHVIVFFITLGGAGKKLSYEIKSLSLVHIFWPVNNIYTTTPKRKRTISYLSSVQHSVKYELAENL